MKVTIAQLDPIVGDVDGNYRRIEETLLRHARGCDLVVFPELFLAGYPPKDLLERNWFIRRVEAGVDRVKALSRSYPETGILFGAPVRTGDPGGRLYNAGLLMCNGEILSVSAKCLLPTYDVFDEARYFVPASEVAPVPFKGEMVGISICEDAWNSPDLWPVGRMYSFDPIECLVSKGATLLINISASPFHQGKEELRYDLISGHARRHGVPFIYVNQVGGNDELVFDGRSLFVDSRGEAVACLPSFSEQTETVDASSAGIRYLYSPEDRIESVYRALVLGLKDYMRKTGFKRAAVGLSGGIDSALTCCIAADAVGPENVLGVSMPSPYSSSGSVDDSRKLAHNLGIDFRVISITGIFEAYLAALKPHFEGLPSDITEENIQARIRGNLLMAFSNKFGCLLLSTGNKSESAVGYCTLYGDMSGGISVISDVPKTIVYELAEYVNREREIIPRETILKAPSAELRPNQTDQDTLPPYPILDEILRYYVEEGESVDDIIARGFEPDVVRWVVKAVDRNEYKRRQAAPGLRVTSKAFGSGRRMPIAARISF